MHQATADWLKLADSQFGPFASVVELGGQDVNGSARSMVRHSRYLSVDLRPGPGVDVVADALTWEPPESFDAVLCTNVLEHVEDWRALVGRAYDLLVSGGVFVVATVCDPFPAHSGIDGEHVRPEEHYANIEPADLFAALLLAGFELVATREVRPDSQAIVRRPENS